MDKCALGFSSGGEKPIRSWYRNSEEGYFRAFIIRPSLRYVTTMAKSRCRLRAAMGIRTSAFLHLLILIGRTHLCSEPSKTLQHSFARVTAVFPAHWREII